MEEQSTHSGSAPSTLQAYLNNTPNLYEYTFNDATRRAVLDTCYQFLWNHNESYQRAYFASNDKAFEKLMETGGASLLSMARSKKDLLHATNSLLETSEIEAEYQPSQRGKQCGHVFQKGETVYRCR
jgi:E3 ubiquitin-protein ligase UBR1